MKRIRDALNGWMDAVLGLKSKPKAPKAVEPKPRIPIAGELWRINNGDPFPPKNTSKVLEVKDGWVRYQIGDGWLFGDERISVRLFTDVWCHHADAPKPESTK